MLSVPLVAYQADDFFTPRAAENKKVRQAVSLELSFLKSNLQFLKEELTDLNSSVEVYQNDDRYDGAYYVVGLKCICDFIHPEM